jgi:AcrR family transcriptional regulator
VSEQWTAKGAATRSRIIDAAATLIYERGLASVGINDVRAATSTSHGQIFHYFPDGRAELLHAVVEHQTRQALDDQRPELTSSTHGGRGRSGATACSRCTPHAPSPAVAPSAPSLRR